MTPPINYAVQVGSIPVIDFEPGVTEVRYVPRQDLNVTDKNVGNLPGVSRSPQSVTAGGITQTTGSLYENKDFTNTIVDVRGTGIITFRNCRFTLTSGYTSADSIAALVRVLNGTNVTEVIFEDCEFHVRIQRPFNGIAGRCVSLKRCVFTGCVDSIRCIPAGSGAMTAASYGFHTWDTWFGDFAWWRSPTPNGDIHSTDLQVHADGDQVQTTLGTTHVNPTIAYYVSQWTGTGTPGSGSDAGNTMVASYVSTQATMEAWRATYCSTLTNPLESYDGQVHLLPNGSEGCSVAAVMVNRVPLSIIGGHMYGTFIPINASDAALTSPVTGLVLNRITFHNDMKNGPGSRATDPTVKGYAIGTRTGRTYPNIPTSGADRNVWSDGSTVIPVNIV